MPQRWGSPPCHGVYRKPHVPKDIRKFFRGVKDGPSRISALAADAGGLSLTGAQVLRVEGV